MKQTGTRFLSLFLCLLLVFGTIFETSVPATETVSENEIFEAVSEEVSANTTAETTSGSDTITIAFYDPDTDEPLLQIPAIYNGSSVYLSEYLESGDSLNIVRRGYPLYRWYSVNNDRNYRSSYIYDSMAFKKDHTFYAVWDTEPYDFSIEYHLNGGTFSDEASVPSTFNVQSPDISLPLPQRAGYLFDGWYTDSGFKTKTGQIPEGFYIDSLPDGSVPDYHVYAKWVSCTPGAVTGVKAVHSAKGKINVSFRSATGAAGYEITSATNKKFTQNKNTKDIGKKTACTFTNLPAGTTYYYKVRAYTTDSTGQKHYGKYSSIVSRRVTKGVQEYTAKSNSGRLQKVAVQKGNTLLVQARVPKRLKSSDGFYYLVKVDPNNGKILKQIAKTDKTVTVRFSLPLRDENGNNHIQGKFGVAVKKGKKYMLITSTSYINNPEASASYTAAFPKPASKKGRQGMYNSDLGDKNYFTNFNLNTIIGTKSYHDVAYKYNGKTYYFINPNFGNISAVNRDGGTVTVQIMLQYSSNAKDLILKSGRTPGANYYAFNTETKAAREKLEAAFCFIAEYASRENYHVDNWIIGNEVNTYANMNAKWYYAGNISRNKFIKNYASTFRILYYAVKSNNKNGRVYICCDHTWINRENDWGTKLFTKAFHDEIKSQNKNIKWNLAYHAYSAVLTNADFWNDGNLAPNNTNADFVSPKNLEILTNYIKNTFGSDVRIILSEQGFSCSGGVGSPYNSGRQTGEDVQAAAVAWLYYKAQFNNMIDAVIFSSGDHGGAGYQFDFIGRQAEDVYKYMDTPQYAAHTNKYLKTIGKASWKKAVNGFNAKKLKQMPSR